MTAAIEKHHFNVVCNSVSFNRNIESGERILTVEAVATGVLKDWHGVLSEKGEGPTLFVLEKDDEDFPLTDRISDILTELEAFSCGLTREDFVNKKQTEEAATMKEMVERLLADVKKEESQLEAAAARYSSDTDSQPLTLVWAGNTQTLRSIRNALESILLGEWWQG